MYKRGKRPGDHAELVRIKEKNKKITINSATISTELAIAQKTKQEKRQNKDRVPRE